MSTHEWHGHTIVYDASLRSYVKDKLSKNHYCPHPHLETPKDIATKSGETHVRGRCTITQIITPIGARYLSSGKK